VLKTYCSLTLIIVNVVDFGIFKHMLLVLNVTDDTD